MVQMLKTEILINLVCNILQAWNIHPALIVQSDCSKIVGEVLSGSQHSPAGLPFRDKIVY